MRSASSCKTLRWYDGFALALANPGFLLRSLGYWVLDLGGWGAAMLWGVTAFLIVFVMVIYSELAAMFPNKSGGFPLYANEGWRKYTDARWADRDVRLLARLVGRARVPRPVRGFDRSGPVVVGGEPYGTNAFGGAEIDAGYFSIWPGSVHVGLQHLIAIGVILFVWVWNFFGARLAVTFDCLAGILPDDPALRLHGPAFPERRLGLGEPDVQAERCRTRLGRLANSARLDLDYDLVRRRRGYVRDLRPRTRTP